MRLPTRRNDSSLYDRVIDVKPELILSLPAKPVPYAVLGQPIHHSFSPAMQQAAFDHLGLDARYFRIEVGEERLARAVEDLRALPFGGWNCTVPNKVKMLDLCDRLDASAQHLKAVNTVVNEGGTLVGHNTDGIGWSRALREAFGEGPQGKRILILGAGGAGRAIAAQALSEHSAGVIIANRNPSRARALVEQLRGDMQGDNAPSNLRMVNWEDMGPALQEVDVIVNATAAGLKTDEPPVLAAGMIPATACVFDTLYGAASEKLHREVEAAGARWSDGLGMLLHQGAAAFTLWTGKEAPVAVMRQALEGAFSASRP